MKKRSLFDELMQGINDITEESQGKVNLRQQEFVTNSTQEVVHQTLESIKTKFVILEKINKNSHLSV